MGASSSPAPVLSRNHRYRLRYDLSLLNKAVLVSMLVQFMLMMLAFKATRHNHQLNNSCTNKILHTWTIPAWHLLIKLKTHHFTKHQILPFLSTSHLCFKCYANILLKKKKKSQKPSFKWGTSVQDLYYFNLSFRITIHNWL